MSDTHVKTQASGEKGRREGAQTAYYYPIIEVYKRLVHSLLVYIYVYIDEIESCNPYTCLKPYPNALLLAEKL